MNKVNWMQAGGVPLRNDDWQFEQEAIHEVLAGITSMIGNHFHISGVELYIGNPTTWTSGYIVLNNEIFRVEAGSINQLINIFGNTYFEVVELNAPGGEVVLENTTTAFIHKIRRATITAYATPQPVGPTRQLLMTVFSNSLQSVIINTIQSQTIAFDKLVQLKEYPTTLSIQSNGYLNIFTLANSFKVNAPAAVVLGGISGDSAIQNGTIITFHMQGNHNDVMGIVHGNNIIVSGNRTAVFRCNASIQLIKSANNWHLLSYPETYQ